VSVPRREVESTWGLCDRSLQLQRGDIFCIKRETQNYGMVLICVGLLKACYMLPRKLLVIAIKAIKHLSTSPQLIEVLQNSNAMEVLVGLLGKTLKGPHANVSGLPGSVRMELLLHAQPPYELI
jgi:hypothetical protein